MTLTTTTISEAMVSAIAELEPTERGLLQTSNCHPRNPSTFSAYLDLPQHE